MRWIREATPPPGDPDVARALNNVGVVVQELGDVPAAAALYKRALAIAEPALGARHPLVGQIVNNLAVTYLLQGQFAEAEPLYERAVTARRAALGNRHPELATALSSESVLFADTNRLPRAVAAQREATDITEHILQ